MHLTRQSGLQKPRDALADVVSALHHDPVPNAVYELNLHLRYQLLRQLDGTLI